MTEEAPVAPHYACRWAEKEVNSDFALTLQPQSHLQHKQTHIHWRNSDVSEHMQD